MLSQLHTIGELHRHLLPREVPQREGWQVAVHYSAGPWPARDFYDILPFPDGRVLFLIADAGDNGTASTALTLMVRIVLHSCPLIAGSCKLPFCPFPTPLTQPPHVLLGHLNRLLAENKLAEQFMTAFCGVLDAAHGGLHYANAGHPAPRWWRAAHRRVEPVPGAAAPPLGSDFHTSYQPGGLLIAPGDLLVLYNDSLTAVPNQKDEMFGQERLDEALCEAAPQGAEAVKSAVLARLDDFLSGKAYPDEITFVIIERQGAWA